MHPKQSLHAIITGEQIRYLKTNDNEQSFIEECRFLTSKLRRCGFPVEIINASMEKLSFCDKQRIVDRRERMKQKIIPFRAEFRQGFERIKLGKILNAAREKHLTLLSGFRFIACYTVAPNLFRIRNARFK